MVYSTGFGSFCSYKVDGAFMLWKKPSKQTPVSWSRSQSRPSGEVNSRCVGSQDVGKVHGMVSLGLSCPFLCAGRPLWRERMGTAAQGSGDTRGKEEQAKLVTEWVNMLACGPILGHQEVPRAQRGHS